MNSTRMRVALLSSLVTAVGAFVLWWIWTPADMEPAPVAEVGPVLFASEETADTTVEAQAVAPQQSTVPDVEELSRVCPAPWGEVGDDCLEALDRRFLDRAARPMFLWMLVRVESTRTWGVPIEERVNWRGVFSDPSALHADVAAALEDSQCVLEKGTARPDLKKACAADSMAKLAELQWACTSLLDEDRSQYSDASSWAEFWNGRRNTLEQDTSRDHDEYLQMRRQLEENRFMVAWRLQKCRGVPESALAHFDRIDPGSRLPSDKTQAIALLEMAGRLGHAWANSRVGGCDADLESLAEFDLTMAHLQRASCYPKDDVRGLANYVAAWIHDFEDGRLDWSGFEESFTETELAEAASLAWGIVEGGWTPYRKPPEPQLPTLEEFCESDPEHFVCSLDLQLFETE